MPSMVENVGVSDSQVVQAGETGGLDSAEMRSELTERQLTEKLEKSEAGRKKLRQAVVLLKEKLDATSNALEVNEALRQEVEKERLNVDTERKRAEAERVLREQVEKENLTIKEQFIGVLQRLDALESSYKADRSEFGRIHGEVKEAVGGIGAALQAVEATKGLYQSLERSLHAKINGAVQSSSKALAIAQSGQATTSRAQAAALAAQSLAKAVQKEVQLVSSQILTLQKQASNLSALEASLQQESQLRGPGTPLNSPDSGEANVVSKEKVASDTVSPSRSSLPSQAAVLSRNQTEAQKSSQVRDVPGEGDMLNMLVASSEKPRSNPVSSSIGLPPRGGMFLSRSQLPDGGLKSQTTTPQIRPGVKSPRKGSSEMVIRDDTTPNASLSQPVGSSLKKGPVAIITGVDSILNPAVRVPALVDSGTKSLPSARFNAFQKQSEVLPQRFPDTSKGLESREFSNKRRVVKRGQGDLIMKQNTFTSGQPARNDACNTLVEADDTFSEGMPQSDGKPYPSSTTKLMKSIMKMFEKEGKNRRSMEDKLMKLQEALESHGGPVQVAQTGSKRKREPKKGIGEGASEEGKKRHRQGKESKKKVYNFSLDDIVASPGELPCTTEDKSLLLEKEAQQNDIQMSGEGQPAQDRLSEMISNLQETCRGEGLFETTVECQENTHVPGTEEYKDSSDVDICNDDVSKEEAGTNTDMESTDDDLGEDWWAKKVLLSPISSNDLAS